MEIILLSHPPIILPNPQVQGQSSPIGKARSRCDQILEMQSHIDKPGELGVKVLRKLVVQSLSKSHSELLWDSYKIDYDKTLNDLIYMFCAVESAMIWNTSKANFVRRSTSQTLNGHWQWQHWISRKAFLFPMERDRPQSTRLTKW